MTHTTNKQIKQAYDQLWKSNNYELYQCYDNYSKAKENAIDEI